MKSILCYGDSNTWGCIPLEGPEPAQPVSAGHALARRAAARARRGLLDRRGRPQRTHDRVGRPARAAPQWAQAAPPHAPDPPASRSGDHHARDERPQAPHERVGGGDRGRAQGCSSTSSPPAAAAQMVVRRRLFSSALPPIAEVDQFDDEFEGGAEKSRQLAGHFAAIAEARSCAFLDAGAVSSSRATSTGSISTSLSMRALGVAVAEQVRPLLA